MSLGDSLEHVIPSNSSHPQTHHILEHVEPSNTSYPRTRHTLKLFTPSNSSYPQTHRTLEHVVPSNSSPTQTLHTLKPVIPAPQIHCFRCNYQSHTFETFWDLSLPIPSEYHVKEKRSMSSIFAGTKTCTLEDCLRKFAEEEILDGNERYHCPCCKRFVFGMVSLRLTALVT